MPRLPFIRRCHWAVRITLRSRPRLLYHHLSLYFSSLPSCLVCTLTFQQPPPPPSIIFPGSPSFVFARLQNALSLIVDLYQFSANFEDYPSNIQSCLRSRNQIPQAVSGASPIGIRTDTVSPHCSVWPLSRMRTSMTNWRGVRILPTFSAKLMC